MRSLGIAPARASLCVGALALVAGACTIDNPGLSPPADRFYYPIGAAISTDTQWLYVVDSDFDLGYNAARVHVVDLESVRARLGTDSGPTPEGPFLASGPNTSVTITPYATTAALRPAITTASGAVLPPRLYIIGRGDGPLTWIDVDGSALSCGAGSDGLCNQAHRVGAIPAGPRQLVMPALPLALDVGTDGFIAVVHQESPTARASLFYDPPEPGRAPLLAHWLGELAPNLDAIIRVPDAAAVSSDPHWYALSRVGPTVTHLRARFDGDRSFLYRSHAEAPDYVTTDTGFRSIARDPCNPARLVATSRPAAGSSTASVAAPEQIALFDASDPELLRVTATLELPPGPSTLVIPRPTAGCGQGTVYAYVVSFDARKVFSVDLDHWRLDQQTRTAAGPNTLVVDETHRHLYVVDFTAMVIQVIDIDASHSTFNQIVFTLGDIVLPDRM